MEARKMKKNSSYIRIAAMLLLLAIAFSLVSCYGEKSGGQSPQNGIEILPTPVYTYKEETVAYAKTVLYSVLYAVQTAKKAQSPSRSEIDEMQRTAEVLVSVTADGSISEERYLSALRAVYAQVETIADVLVGKRPLAEVESLYATLADLIGKRYVADCLYEALLRYFEYRRQAAENSYAQTGTAAHLVVIRQQQKNIAALKESVGRKNLSFLLDYAFLLSEIKSEGVFDTGAIELSDSELLMLLTYLDPSEMSIGAEGWELLLCLSAETVLLSESPGFLRKMQFAAAKNGDAAELSKKMDAFVALICASQSRLDKDSVALVREGNFSELLLQTVRKFEAEDFERLDEVFSVSFENLEYSTLANGYYGAAYSEFLKDPPRCTLAQLIAAQNTDALYNTLKGYIAGKCPALAYAMFEADD